MAARNENRITEALNKIIAPYLIATVRNFEQHPVDSDSDSDADADADADADSEEESEEKKEERIQQYVRELLEKPWSRDIMSETLKAWIESGRPAGGYKFILERFLDEFEPKWMQFMIESEDMMKRNLADLKAEQCMLSQESLHLEAIVWAFSSSHYNWPP